MKNRKAWVQLGVLGLVAALFVYFIVNNRHELVEGLRVAVNLPWAVFGPALLLVCLTFVLAAGSYRMLALKRLSFHELLTVELAAAFINRLIPSGVGGLGMHGVYLYRRKHSVAQATAVVSTNNLLGILIHTALLLILIVFFGNTIEFHLHWGRLQTVLLAGIVLVLICVIGNQSVHSKVRLFVRNLLKSLKRYRQQPHMLIFAALALFAMTITHLLILYSVAHAVGVDLALTKLFIVYSVGVLFGATVPTPGGLAGVEAGLVAGFIAYGVSSELAIATTLTFRLITYWFPLVPGSIAFIFARQKHLV